MTSFIEIHITKPKRLRQPVAGGTDTQTGRHAILSVKPAPALDEPEPYIRGEFGILEWLTARQI